ncbi:hypothetical protein MRB53_020702 [Persea americana]|uniref:Uncharacterized protein n=1 Tax=Persea americana TaxID=3435 RepID=A0ACC2L2C8_PERAE|nr:hypothetical protein MRB53_020702 [Persea americana]
MAPPHSLSSAIGDALSVPLQPRCSDATPVVLSSAGLPQVINALFSSRLPQRNPQTSSAPLWSSRLPQHRQLLCATHSALLKVADVMKLELEDVVNGGF